MRSLPGTLQGVAVATAALLVGLPSCEADPAPAPCPAAGTAGLAVGEVLPDLEVVDCDGNPVALRDLVCGTAEDPRPPLTLLDLGSALYPACLEATDRYATDPDFDALQARGLRIVQVFDLDEKGEEPTPEWCKAYAEKHEIDFTFLIDPQGVTSGHAVAHPFNVALDDQATVVLRWEGGPILGQEDELSSRLPP